MEFRVLGPLEVIDGGKALSLGGPRQRLVLAYLLLEANRVVPTGRLIDQIWGDEPPDAARAALFAYVSRLRKLLGADRIKARPPGYILVAERDEIDALRFVELVEEAHRSADRDATRSLLGRALDLWRGGALSDLADHDALQPAITRLDEMRLGALEDRIDADLDVGRHRDAIASLESLTREHPLREKLWSQLMLGLYRSGRQGDALAAFHRARNVLVDELGIDPSPDLRRLHEQVLAQDPALDLARKAAPGAAVLEVPVRADRTERPTAFPTPVSTARRFERRVATWIGTALLALVMAGALLIRPAPSSTAVIAIPNSVLRLDPATGAISAVVHVGTRPKTIAYGDSSLWVANFDDKTIQPIDPATANAGAALGGFPGNPTAVAVSSGVVWVGVGFPSGRVLRVDLAAHNAIASASGTETGLEAIAFGEGALWVTNSQANSLTRIDARAATQIRRMALPDAGPGGVAVTPGAVWLAAPLKRAVIEIDPQTLTVRRTIEVLSGAPNRIAYGEGYVWVTNTEADAVIRIDPKPNGSSTTITGVGNGPIGLAAGEGGVWVANGLGPSVSHIDPVLGTVTGSIELPDGVSPFDVVVGGGWVWVTLQAG